MSRQIFFVAVWLVCARAGQVGAELNEADIEGLLQQIASRCSASHGYDPYMLDEIGDYALAPGEKDWRECVYAGIRKDLLPRSAVPEQYERIIADDIAFTAAIEAGEMTRYDRWQRNRTNKQMAVMNERLNETVGIDKQRDAMGQSRDDFMQHQMQDLLRAPMRRATVPRPR